MPTFSIIIPTFNARAKLELTLDSIRAQNFDDLEILVCDGASTDGTARWLATQSDVSWRSESDRGVYDAMNKGIARARGRYLYFMGAGDLLRPGVLPQIAALLPRHEAALLYGRVFWVSENEDYGTAFAAPDLARRNIAHQATFYGRELFERFGPYDLNYPIFADYALNLALWQRADKRWIDLTVADYEGGGLSVRERDEQFERDRLRLVWRHLGPASFLIVQLDRLLPTGAKNFLRRLRHLRP